MDRLHTHTYLREHHWIPIKNIPTSPILKILVVVTNRQQLRTNVKCFLANRAIVPLSGKCDVGNGSVGNREGER